MSEAWEIHWKDYYEILQVSRHADPDIIEVAYKRLVATYHPDKATGNEEKMKVIVDAYDVLRDVERRKRYDLSYQHRQGADSADMQRIFEAEKREREAWRRTERAWRLAEKMKKKAEARPLFQWSTAFAYLAIGLALGIVIGPRLSLLADIPSPIPLLVSEQRAAPSYLFKVQEVITRVITPRELSQPKIQQRLVPILARIAQETQRKNLSTAESTAVQSTVEHLMTTIREIDSPSPDLDRIRTILGRL